MGEYKAKKRDDKPSGNKSTADNIKEKGGSMALQASGIPKPFADLLSKKAAKNNKRLPGMPKVPGSHSRTNKPKESEKQKESTKEQDNDKNKERAKKALGNTKLGRAKAGIDQLKNVDSDEGTAKVMVNLVKALVVAIPSFISLLPVLLAIVFIGALLAVLSHYGIIDNLSQLKPLNERNYNQTETASNINNLVLIGDSRTVGMYDAVNNKSTSDSTNLNVTDSNNVSWSAKVSMGYDWMVSTGITQVESKITKDTGVVILMGVNDMGNIDKYISYINNKGKEWSNKGAKTYFASVNPVNDSKAKANGYGETNSMIENFNSKLKSGVSGVTYIDIYSSIKGEMTNGTTDGLHYTKTVYKKVYDKIVSITGTSSGQMGPTNGKQGTYYAPVQNGSTGFSKIGSTQNCSNNVSHDLNVKEGVELYAGMDGTAEFIQSSCNGVLYSYGNHVRLKSSDGTYIIYAHLKSFVGGTLTPITNTCSKKGNTPPCPSTSCKGGVTSKTVATKTVKKGELIGYTGNTGNSMKPHLHVEIHEKGSSSCIADPWKAFGMR